MLLDDPRFNLVLDELLEIQANMHEYKMDLILINNPKFEVLLNNELLLKFVEFEHDIDIIRLLLNHPKIDPNSDLYSEIFDLWSNSDLFADTKLDILIFKIIKITIVIYSHKNSMYEHGGI